MEDKSISAEFLHQSLESNISKLYFYALNYILPIPNKMNVIFQGDYSTVQRVYKDSTDMLVLLLSCYMKLSYVRSTNILDIDPTSTVNFSPLNQIYLGVHVTQLIDSIAQDVRQRREITPFLQRMQSFLIQLCVELKSRLPLNKLFEQMQFLDPQNVVYKEFTTLSNTVSQFPNLVHASDIQEIDSEYREIKLDTAVRDLLEAGGSSDTTAMNTERFWSHVSKMTKADGTKKYSHLVDFTKAMMILPMSNTACERIFSQMNNIKTNLRNKFQNEHVSAILHVKQAVKEQDRCVNFTPSKHMIKMAQNSTVLYKNTDIPDNI